MRGCLIFFLGFILGAVTLFFVIGVISQTPNDDVMIFETPGERINAKSFRVIQVLDNGSALATDYYNPFSNLIVMLAEREGVYYYDNQIVELPKGCCWKQMGTFKYTSNSGDEKTVPIVNVFNK